MSGGVPWWANSLLSTLLALVVAWAAVSFDRHKTINQELVRKRIAVYEQIAPLLGDMYGFFFAFGAPLPVTPPEMIERKDALDRLFRLYEPLFSERLSNEYFLLVREMFDMVNCQWNQPPPLRANLTVFKSGREQWPPEWDNLFVPDGDTNIGSIMHRYHALIDQFALEIGARPWRSHWLTRWRKRRRGI